MTLPLGGGGLTPGDWWLHQGALQPVSRMATDRNQAAMTTFYKTLVKESAGYQGAKAGVWAGLDTTLPLPAAIIQALVQKAFDDVTDTVHDIESALSAAAARFSDKWLDIISAQTSADYANAQLAAQNRAISDLFDAGTAGSLSSTTWDVVYSALAGGTVGVDGKGNLVWNPFGGLGRKVFCRYKPVTLATNRQRVSTVMAQKVQDPLLGGDSWARVYARVNNTNNTAVYGEWGNNTARIGCMVSGTETVLASVSQTTGNGDSWDFYAGTPADDYEFKLYRNGVSVFNGPVVDGDHISQLGGANRYVGLGMYAANRALFTLQTSPGKMAVFSADDY